LLSKLLELYVSDSEQRRLESEQRQLESTLRSVCVHRWDAPISSMVKLRTSFDHFFVEALAAVKISGAARLYLIMDEKWAERRSLTFESYASFLEQSRDLKAKIPDVFIFEQMPSAKSSPEGPPILDREAPADVHNGLDDNDGDDGVSRSRSSAMQSDFRQALMLRDGSECVLCRNNAPLEAAHIIPRIADQSEMLAAGLLTLNVPTNGMMLCIPCHRLHDSFMWCFNPDTGVVVADALLHDKDLGSLWRDRVGNQLVKPPVDDAVKTAWWPPPLVWAAAIARFEAAKLERHEKADSSPHFCNTCGKRFEKGRGVTEHTCG